MKDKIFNIGNCININYDQLIIITHLAKYLLEKIKILIIIEIPYIILDEEEQNYSKNLFKFIRNGFIIKNR